jgi:hypothetical protein
MEPAWTHARAVFLGLGVLEQDLVRGLRLARGSRHPDAAWLVSVFAEGAPANSTVARALLLQQGNDLRAQCFAALLVDPVDHGALLSAAKRGNALAMALLAKESELGSAERFLWASRSAEANEPRGLCELGTCYWFGWACEQSKERALELYRAAARMGDCDATLFYATDGFSEEQPERYVHLGRAAAAGSDNAALLLVEETPRRFEDLRRGLAHSARCVFELGAAFREHIVGQTLFGRSMPSDKVRAAARAVAMHAESCERAKQAIQTWLLVGRKRNVVRDIRGSIAKMLWANRADWSANNSWKRPKRSE